MESRSSFERMLASNGRRLANVSSSALRRSRCRLLGLLLAELSFGDGFKLRQTQREQQSARLTHCVAIVTRLKATGQWKTRRGDATDCVASHQKPLLMEQCFSDDRGIRDYHQIEPIGTRFQPQLQLFQIGRPVKTRSKECFFFSLKAFGIHLRKKRIGE